MHIDSCQLYRSLMRKKKKKSRSPTFHTSVSPNLGGKCEQSLLGMVRVLENRVSCSVEVNDLQRQQFSLNCSLQASAAFFLTLPHGDAAG